jgi:hypothetical protein
VPEEIARFERELGCAKLRPQIARLRESLGTRGVAGPAREQPASAVESETPSAGTAPIMSSPPLSASEVCKRDEEKLVRLRANPLPEELARFERELGCTRLRPQVVRLRESLGAN